MAKVAVDPISPKVGGASPEKLVSAFEAVPAIISEMT